MAKAKLPDSDDDGDDDFRTPPKKRPLPEEHLADVAIVAWIVHWVAARERIMTQLSRVP
jgi:hypothetical protein